MNPKPLSDKIALVAGATRGAGRGIATALGEAGATVYCTGRSTRDGSATTGRPETIEETSEIVAARGGIGIALRVDHTVPREVESLAERIKREAGGLDILVNDVWGGDDLTQWGKPLWEHSLEDGLLMLERGIHSHIITSRFVGPLLFDRPNALLVIEAAMDDAWKDLVATATTRLAACAPGVELASDRKTLTLGAGRAKREVLAPELFFSKPETIAAELCAMYARPAANPETSLSA